MTSPEIADALAQEIRRVDGNNSLGAGALAEALMPFLSAALAAGAPGVKVRELAWREDRLSFWTATTGFVAVYGITEYAGMKEPFMLSSPMMAEFVHYATLEAAKAAAQADYEARILSALEPAPSALVAEPGEPVAWTSQGQLDAIAKGGTGTIYGKPDEFLPIALYAAPPAGPEHVSALREALRPFADAARLWSPEANGGHVFDDAEPLEGDLGNLTIGHLRRAVAALAQSAATVQPSPAMRETMWGEVVDDDYEGIAFRLTEEGNRDGHHFLKEIALAAETFPLGTKITVAEPVQQAAPSGEGE